ncbi:hypothetical protein DLJ59_15335 [Micromonospora inaquosa]|uniref:Carboxymuconolactone decarboxylase-like domain-containing protein n=1 Tax=Micromonospora inaquosa TaxID=2203716 RepID=A0A3N9WNX2_9ACTN|nr:hypothetical protein DLJ59_15335 [Micromonospora inaquosa]
MSDPMYHPTTPEIAAQRKELAPETHDAFEAFTRAVFADGALPEKTKQLIAVAAAHTTRPARTSTRRLRHTPSLCPVCGRGARSVRCSRQAGPACPATSGVSSPTRPSLAAPPGESNAVAFPGSGSAKNRALSAVNTDHCAGRSSS